MPWTPQPIKMYLIEITEPRPSLVIKECSCQTNAPTIIRCSFSAWRCARVFGCDAMAIELGGTTCHNRIRSEPNMHTRFAVEGPITDRPIVSTIQGAVS